MALHGLSQAELAVAAPEALLHLGVTAGNHDALTVDPETQAWVDAWRAEQRAQAIADAAGPMTRDEFAAALRRVLEMVDGN